MNKNTNKVNKAVTGILLIFTLFAIIIVAYTWYTAPVPKSYVKVNDEGLITENRYKYHETHKRLRY